MVRLMAGILAVDPLGSKMGEYRLIKELVVLLQKLVGLDRENTCPDPGGTEQNLTEADPFQLVIHSQVLTPFPDYSLEVVLPFPLVAIIFQDILRIQAA